MCVFKISDVQRLFNKNVSFIRKHDHLILVNDKKELKGNLTKACTILKKIYKNY